MAEERTMPAVLRAFAEARQLEVRNGGELPRAGGLLGEKTLKVVAQATGVLPGGEEGTLAHVTYEYKDDDDTRTALSTVAVIPRPQTTGFLPYLRQTSSEHYPARSADKLGGIRTFTSAGTGVSMVVHDGTSDPLLQELISPALANWLKRSPEGFGFELDHGVLCVSREGHLHRSSDLERLCVDAAHLATVLHEEAREEIAGGAAKSSAAKRSARQRRVDEFTVRLVELVPWPTPPPSIYEAVNVYRETLQARPGTYIAAAVRTVGFMLAVNLIGGGIYALLLNLPSPLVAVLIYQAILIAIIYPRSIRHTIEMRAKLAGTEAFFREYATARRLRQEDPLVFAATHADLGLPAADRVLTGGFVGIEGALVLTGDGSERGHQVALAASTGKVATAELEVPAPGISARALDDYTSTLARQLREPAR